LRTFVLLLLRPSASFRVCPEPVAHGRVLRFLATLRLPAWVVLVAVLALDRVRAGGPQPEPLRAIHVLVDPALAQALSAWLLLMVPVGLPLWYFAGGLVAHVGIALTGGAPRSIGATMRAVGYASGPAMLAIGLLDIPLYLGRLETDTYLLVLGAVTLLFLANAGIAIARTHQIGLSRGLLVALLPAVILSGANLGRAGLALIDMPGLETPDNPYYIP
jgi:hypothetical protein